MFRFINCLSFSHSYLMNLYLTGDTLEEDTPEASEAQPMDSMESDGELYDSDAS